MNLRDVQRNWNAFGRKDPYWAILTTPGKEKNGWERDEFFATGREEIASVMEYVSRIAPDLQRRRALDFGCGVGRLTQPLAQHFDHAIGVDIARSMIELAREANMQGDRCEFILNERDDLSVLPSDSFDFVYSNITLQHMPPRYARRYLRELMRVLARRGILLFQLPSRLAKPRHRIGRTLLPAVRLYRKLVLREATMEMYGMPQRQVRELLEDEGAEVVSIAADQSAGTVWEGFRYCARKVR